MNKDLIKLLEVCGIGILFYLTWMWGYKEVVIVVFMVTIISNLKDIRKSLEKEKYE